MSEIKVKVTKHGDRRFLIMYYDDPPSGKRVQRSTGTINRKKAREVAVEWQAELRHGLYKKPSTVTWSEARQKFEDEHLADKPERTFTSYATAMNAFETVCRPQKLRDVDAARLKYFKKQLGEKGLTNGTIANYLRHLRTFLNWCADPDNGGLLDIRTLPSFKKLIPMTEAKGRPLVGEEVDRLIMALPEILKPAKGEALLVVVASRERTILGYLHSGFRLDELLGFRWEDDGSMSEMHVTDVDGENPMVFIPAGKQKNRAVGYYPLTPELVDLMRQTAPEIRQGFVFNPLSKDGTRRVGYHRTSRVIALAGKKAGIVVKRYDNGKTKFASTQDLRRTFSNGICDDVPIHVAKKFTRHKSEATLLKFYATKDAQEAGRALRQVRAKVGTSVGTSQNPAPNASGPDVVNTEAETTS